MTKTESQTRKEIIDNLLAENCPDFGEDVPGGTCGNGTFFFSGEKESAAKKKPPLRGA